MRRPISSRGAIQGAFEEAALNDVRGQANANERGAIEAAAAAHAWKLLKLFKSVRGMNQWPPAGGPATKQGPPAHHQI